MDPETFWHIYLAAVKEIYYEPLPSWFRYTVITLMLLPLLLTPTSRPVICVCSITVGAFAAGTAEKDILPIVLVTGGLYLLFSLVSDIHLLQESVLADDLTWRQNARTLHVQPTRAEVREQPRRHCSTPKSDGVTVE